MISVKKRLAPHVYKSFRSPAWFERPAPSIDPRADVSSSPTPSWHHRFVRPSSSDPRKSRPRLALWDVSLGYPKAALRAGSKKHTWSPVWIVRRCRLPSWPGTGFRVCKQRAQRSTQRGHASPTVSRGVWMSQALVKLSLGQYLDFVSEFTQGHH